MKFPNRLKAIRQAKGLSLEKLAALVNTSRGQIYQLENGLRKLSHDWMIRLANALKCAPEDLIRSPLVPIIGEVGAGGEVYPIDDLPLLPRKIDPSEQDYLNCEWIDGPPGVYPAGVVALRVTGPSMKPYMPPGTIVYYAERFENGAPDHCLSSLCVVQLRDGRTLVKLVRKSHLHGRFDLQSYNMDTITDVELAWCAPVIFIKPVLGGRS
jgi:transcriptional regulator with XRE-family HTH domain